MLIAAALFVLLLIFLFIRQWGEFNSQNDRLAREEEKLLSASVSLVELLEIQKRAPEFRAYMQTLIAYMPDIPYEDDIIYFLEQKSLRTGSDIVRVRFDGEKDMGSYMEVPVNLFFKGEINGFLSILNYLQKPPPGERVYRIERVRLQKETMELGASVFYRKESSATELE